VRSLHRRSKRAVGEEWILVACRSGESGAVAARVQFFEFSEPLPHVAPDFPDPISHKKKFIESLDLKMTHS
jgi:hypothetical protein